MFAVAVGFPAGCVSSRIIGCCLSADILNMRVCRWFVVTLTLYTVYAMFVWLFVLFAYQPGCVHHAISHSVGCNRCAGCLAACALCVPQCQWKPSYAVFFLFSAGCAMPLLHNRQTEARFSCWCFMCCLCQLHLSASHLCC